MSSLNPFCLAFVLTLAVQIGWSFAVGLVVSTSQELRDDEQKRRGMATETVRLTLAGEPVIERREPSLAEAGYLRVPDRTPIAAPELLRLPEFQLEEPRRFVGHDPRRVFRIERPQRSEETYLVYDGGSQKLAHFEMFDQRTRARLGFLSRDGWSETRQAAEFELGELMRSWGGGPVLQYESLDQFRRQLRDAEEGQVAIVSDREPGFPFDAGQCVLLSRGEVLLVDFDERVVRELLDGEEVTAITLFARHEETESAGDAAGKEPPTVVLYVACRTPRHVILLHPRTGRRHSLPIPDGVTSKTLLLASLPGGATILSQFGPWTKGETSLTRRIWWASAEGNLLRQESVTTDVSYWASGLGERAERNFILAAAGSPLSAGAICLAISPALDQEALQRSFGAHLGEWVRATWPTWLAIVAMGAACAWGVDRHRRRRRLPCHRGWMAFAFLLGAPGYFGYVLHRRWPVLTPAPTPPRLGIEVFA
jgi:hypothetical protein